MDTFSLLKAKRPAVIQIAAKHGAYDIRGIMQHEVGELRTAIQAMLDVSVDDEG